MAFRLEDSGLFFQEYEDGNGIFFDQESGMVYLLNPTALLICKLSGGITDRNELFGAFMERVDTGDEEISADEIRADFDSVLEDIEDHELSLEDACQENDEAGGEWKLKYESPVIDRFCLEDLLEEIEGRKTTSAHCSHCYGTFK